MMRTARILALVGFVLLVYSLPADAQRRRRPAPKPTPRATPKPPPASAEVTQAKGDVSIQLYNVNAFVDKLGPIAVTLENVEAQARSRRLSQKEAAAHEQNKQKMVEAFRRLRAGLVTLETRFRTKPALSRYLIKIQGISDLCARAEDHAIAAKFVMSKDPLRDVAQKLTDTMAVMP